jgi:DNA invertase Pin-like site-specific DNA recombinase
LPQLSHWDDRQKVEPLAAWRCPSNHYELLSGRVLARGSTETQRLELERIAEARGWSLVDRYTDHGISGAKFGKQRPALERLRKDAARRRFDVLMAWSIDRIGRSTHEVSGLMEEFDSLGIAQYYVQQAIDTSTPHGRAMVQMAAVFAELERAMIRERIKAGLDRVRKTGRTKSGKPIGRPRVPAHMIDKVLAAKAKGKSMRAIANLTGLSVGKVHGIVAANSHE